MTKKKVSFKLEEVDSYSPSVDTLSNKPSGFEEERGQDNFAPVTSGDATASASNLSSRANDNVSQGVDKKNWESIQVIDLDAVQNVENELSNLWLGLDSNPKPGQNEANKSSDSGKNSFVSRTKKESEYKKSSSDGSPRMF